MYTLKTLYYEQDILFGRGLTLLEVERSNITFMGSRAKQYFRSDNPP